MANSKGLRYIILALTLLVAGGGAYLFLAPAPEAPEETVSMRMKIDTPPEATPPEALPGETRAAEPAPETGTTPMEPEKPEEPEKIDKPTKTAIEPLKEAVARAKTGQATPKAKEPGRYWVVNVASFLDKGQAQDMKASLAEEKYDSYVAEFTKDGKMFNRVRIGFFKSADEAQRAAKAMSSRYQMHDAWVAEATREEIAKYRK